MIEFMFNGLITHNSLCLIMACILIQVTFFLNKQPAKHPSCLHIKILNICVDVPQEMML